MFFALEGLGIETLPELCFFTDFDPSANFAGFLLATLSTLIFFTSYLLSAGFLSQCSYHAPKDEG
jgi:hypothetical protein